MALTSTARVQVFTGDNVWDSQKITFRFEDNAHIIVHRVEIASGAKLLYAETTDYDLVGAGDDNGGTITLVAGALSSLYRLHVERIVPLTQLSRFANVGVAPRALEARMDLAYMALQQIENRLVDPTVYTDAGKPVADETYLGQFIYVRDSGEPMRVLICGQDAAGNWVWEDFHIFSF